MRTILAEPGSTAENTAPMAAIGRVLQPVALTTDSLRHH
ncbi:hypothetical protein FHT03_003976 [Xanthomonas arboricola]|uniref:Transposase n=1 Tax=Xanthomonas cannabis TaxID=1885674 RepID=A0ABR6JND9_9XANT|nr:hypothetical protein [Xanthomonas cannabis]MBB4594343.1 hypothetical protein [Xanthomonas cannabis]MBB5522913.1 hypothetical protein [Xanthomonas cannabis]